jgi:predicted regulator of amino acid metabolism with ACT domain
VWNKISKYFQNHPERLVVAKVLVENGLSVRENRIYCNEIEVPAIRVARSVNLDRRTVVETLRMIDKNKELKVTFTHIRSAGLSLKEIARHYDYGVIEITPLDPRKVGILAEASSLLAEHKISIRQALVDDPELHPKAKLTLIAEKKIPGDLIPKFLKIRGVAQVSVY